MKKELSVANIIENMSQSEKRYFKLINQYTQRDKNYMKLFDIYDKNKEADNDFIKKKLVKVSSNLSQEKAYLQWQLLHSLHYYHEPHSHSIQLHNTLCEIEVLYNKRLFDWCLKLIYHNKPLAQKGEYFPQLLQFIEWEQRCNASATVIEYFEKEHVKIFQQEEDVIAALEELRIIKKEKMHILSFMMPFSFIKTNDTNNLKKIIDVNEKKSIADMRSTRAVLQHLEMLCLGHQYFFNNEKAFHYCQQALALLNENKDIIAHHLLAYHAFIANAISLCIQLSMYKEAFAYILQYEAISENKKYKVPTHVEVEMKINTTIYKLIIHVSLHQYKEGLVVTENTKKLFLHYEREKRKDSLILYFYHAALLYLFNNNAKECLSNLNIIFNDLDEAHRQDYYTCSMMMQLMAHYDLNNYRLISPKVQSVKRYLQTRNIHLEAANIILKCFDKLEKHLKEKHKNIFNNLYKDLEKLDQSNKDESYYIQTLMIMEWLEMRRKR